MKLIIEGSPSTCICSATTKILGGTLLGRSLVGIGMGLGPSVASLYVIEVSPSFVRGTYGSFSQIARCLGLMGALFIGIPVKEMESWCVFGRLSFQLQFLLLVGGSHVKSAIAELLKSDRGDGADTIKLSELLYGGHFRAVWDNMSKRVAMCLELLEKNLQPGMHALDVS